MDSPGTGSGDAAIDSERAAALGPRIEAEMAKERSLDSVSNLHEVHNDDAAVASTTSPQEASIHESQIFVRACNRTIALSVNLQCDSVEEVKRAIEEREGIPVKEQHLIAGGKPLRQGTFLRDYDALGHQSTVHVSTKIRGGTRTQEKTIEDFLKDVYALRHPGEGGSSSRIESEGQSLPGSKALIDEENPIPGQQDSMPALLNKLGRRILHGVLSCVLSAHEAGITYDGLCDMDHLRVSVYEGTTKFVRVVCVGDGKGSQGDLLITRQEKDYEALKGVIEKLFPVMPRDVQSIHILLDRKLAEFIPSHPDKRTQLLQAHVAMVSSSIGVATMCLNLMRFYEQLPDEEKEKEKEKEEKEKGRGRGRGKGASEKLSDRHMGKGKAAFENAIMPANNTNLLKQTIEIQSLFKDVFTHETNNRQSQTGTSDRVPSNPYIGNTGMEVLSFARNWFTHAPHQRWLGSHGGNGNFEGLPHLDHIFTHHFGNYISEALLHLYKDFHDHKLLTEVLVPLA